MSDEYGWWTLDQQDPGRLVPTDMARSMWSGNQLHGVAIASALARTAEAASDRDDLRPARLSVDLFKAATMDPVSLHASVVREGPRLCLIDVSMTQNEEPVARASVQFLKVSANPEGKAWSAGDRPSPPPLEVAPVTEEPHIPFFASDSPWSDNFSDHQNPGRKAVWQVGIPTLVGVRPTPFEAIAGIADSASLVTNWGTRGVEYINTDITLTLSRLPDGLEMGLRATDRLEEDGIAVGTAEVYDRQGPFGTCVVTAIANAKRQVNFDGVDFNEDDPRGR